MRQSIVKLGYKRFNLRYDSSLQTGRQIGKTSKDLEVQLAGRLGSTFSSSSLQSFGDSLLIGGHQLFSKATRLRFGVANGRSLAIRFLGELASNVIVIVDFMPKE